MRAEKERSPAADMVDDVKKRSRITLNRHDAVFTTVTETSLTAIAVCVLPEIRTVRMLSLILLRRDLQARADCARSPFVCVLNSCGHVRDWYTCRAHAISERPSILLHRIGAFPHAVS